MNLTLSLISLIRKTAKGGMISLTRQADLEAYVVRHGGRHVQFRTQMWDVVLKFGTRDWRSLWLVSNCWQLNHARSIFHLEQVDTAYLKKICNIKLWKPETSETLFIWRFISINYVVFLVSHICPIVVAGISCGGAPRWWWRPRWGHPEWRGEWRGWRKDALLLSSSPFDRKCILNFWSVPHLWRSWITQIHVIYS